MRVEAARLAFVAGIFQEGFCAFVVVAVFFFFVLPSVRSYRMIYARFTRTNCCREEDVDEYMDFSFFPPLEFISLFASWFDIVNHIYVNHTYFFYRFKSYKTRKAMRVRSGNFCLHSYTGKIMYK